MRDAIAEWALTLWIPVGRGGLTGARPVERLEVELVTGVGNRDPPEVTESIGFLEEAIPDAGSAGWAFGSTVPKGGALWKAIVDTGGLLSRKAIAEAVGSSRATGGLDLLSFSGGLVSCRLKSRPRRGLGGGDAGSSETGG